jgi:signal transduction histidine kinase
LVEDDGRGFDASMLDSRDDTPTNDPRQQGLITLREKYELVEGSVVFDSSEAQGTSIRVELPAGASR